jgi:WD40 repeat protein
MDHVCQFMRSFEQDEEQDFRIMSASLFREGEKYFAAFGNSQGLL